MNERDRNGVSRLGLVLLLASFAALGAALGAYFSRPTGDASTRAHAAKELWTCSMHPQVLRDEPGLCPICHMELTPLSAATDVGALVIDPSIVQKMGVRTTHVRRASIGSTVRGFGALREREPDHTDVTLRVSGWIGTLHANVEGMTIAQGDPLFDVESPELVVAIDELIAARRQERALGAQLFATARTRLGLLGLDDATIEELARMERAPTAVTFRSPLSGHVAEKRVYAGARVEKGALVIRIARNEKLWLDVRVFERDLAAMRVGAKVRARVDALPGKSFEGAVTFVHPHLDMETRTAIVRAELDNSDMILREGMWASAEIEAPVTPDALCVPREAIIDTGARRVAFVALGLGRFDAREVEIGVRGDGGIVEVLSGLALDEEVVVSGQLLLDSESRLREAVRKFLEPTRADVVTPLARIDPAWTARVDAAVSAYLVLARELGRVQSSPAPLDIAPLASAADDLAAVGLDARIAPLSIELARATHALEGKTLDLQRELFKSASAAMVALVERAPPSAAVAAKLFVMRCPMAPGSWLQTQEVVLNPYYPDSMKSCGSVVRTIDLAPGGSR